MIACPIFNSRLLGLIPLFDLIVAQREMPHLLLIDWLIAEHAADIRAVSQCRYHDAFIAATAKVHNLTLVTRNIADFEACGIDLCDSLGIQRLSTHKRS